jgi:hypothetical protein
MKSLPTKQIQLLIFNLILLHSYKSISITLEHNKEFCLFKDLITNDILKFSYIVSGDLKAESSVNIKAYDPIKNVLYNNGNRINKENTSKDTFELSINMKGKYSICMTPSQSRVNVSFEISTLSETGHIISLAKNETFDDVFKNLTEVGSLFEEIDKNMKFFHERRDVHSKSKSK